MYIVGIVVLKSFQLFSIKNWSIPAFFLGAFTAQSSLWVFPEFTTKRRVCLQILIRLSTSFLSWSSFPPLEGEMWSLCFRLLPSACVLSLFLSSTLCPFVPKCSLSVILAYPPTAGPRSRNKRSLCFFASLPHDSEKQKQMMMWLEGKWQKPASKFQCHKGHNLFWNSLNVEKQATGFCVQPRLYHLYQQVRKFPHIGREMAVAHCGRLSHFICGKTITRCL